MHLIEFVRMSFTDLRRFFAAVSTEPPSHILAFMGLLYLWYALVSTPFFLLSRFVFGFSFVSVSEYLSILPISFALVFVFWFFSIFIWAAIVHAFISMWGGSARFIGTFRCIAYGFTPLFVLAPVLFYGLLLTPYTAFVIFLLYTYVIYVIVKGLSLTHRVSFTAAFISYLIPFLAVCAWAVYTLWRHFGV